ncbi:DUF998 domain-containing protein [Thermococcus peptonophilus]|uniref:DUF998 domain-containing protein n=1 Tax=Thermococcus peptonophilus TaxID=53952 RepID=A0A142CSS5_9EURY|nr:DUF998 domain-containing protein [Thermococcus peptonophilus]AMQ17827.1 hypothetical protein A0127_00865 [Thermococcus peptonophilus]
MWREGLRWSGIVSGIVYWLFVAWSISRNRWFSFFHNALSDLGDPSKATAPWIYNYGLIVTSLFVLAFAIYLILASENRLQTVGGAYISISAIFLALIGIFHGGTRPHVFVSTYFFVQFFLGALIYGVGSEKREIRYGSVLIFLLALFGTFLEWSSVALIETYEIALVMTFTLLVALRGGGKNA